MFLLLRTKILIITLINATATIPLYAAIIAAVLRLALTLGMSLLMNLNDMTFMRNGITLNKLPMK